MDGETKVCITGAGGSIGSAIARMLHARGVPLILADCSENALFEIDHATKGTHLALLGDVRNTEFVRRISSYEPAYTIHAAAYKHAPLMESRPVDAWQNNVLATANVVQVLRNVTLISTDKAVHPCSVMGATKRVAERVTLARGGKVLRLCNVIGSNASVLKIWEKQLSEGKPLSITDPDMERYFITVEQAALAACNIADDLCSGFIYMPDFGRAQNILEMAQDFLTERGYSPEFYVVTGRRPGERLTEQIRYEDEKWVGERQGVQMYAPDKVEYDLPLDSVALTEEGVLNALNRWTGYQRKTTCARSA